MGLSWSPTGEFCAGRRGSKQARRSASALTRTLEKKSVNPVRAGLEGAVALPFPSSGNSANLSLRICKMELCSNLIELYRHEVTPAVSGTERVTRDHGPILF